jgi:hypothetical protein
MSKARHLIAVLTTATAGAALAQAVSAPRIGAPRFDPFHPELWLNPATALVPATQPTFPTDSGTGDSTGTPAPPPPRPIIRDPLRPPTRSPFRP